MTDRAPRRNSIRRRVLTFLIPSLLLLVLLGACFSYFEAVKIAALSYDRSLLDPALDMAENVRVGADGPRLDMLVQAQEALLYDREDKLVFQIRDAQGAVIAGSSNLAAPPALAPGERVFFDGLYENEPVRIAAIRSDSGVYVQVGETLNKRKRLIGEMLAGDLIPTLMIAFGSFALAWMGVSHGIAPLARVTSDLLGRLPLDLRPLDSSIAPTEVAPVVDAFNRVLSQLRESTAMQQRFLADAAHQLRTPLAGLQMHLELLLQRPLTADVRKEVEMMQSATLRASHLANQLLVLAKAEAGATAVAHAQEINLRSLAHDAVQEWVPRAIARDIDLGFELRDATVAGDPLLLGELLDNLIDNALRYTPSGGAVTVRSGYEGESPCLSVEDTGPGIPLWAHDKVFERFYRIEGS
ncbi:MAG TPA: sensor histidine kinase, partial [Casimicrobiaceae bacterium]|nr:sensor histidine kinase [Casimicrobiaceae bacterium]